MAYLDELFGLTGRTAVITGGNSGIGRGIAEAVGRAGARVVIIGRDQTRLDSCVAELSELDIDASGLSVDLGRAAGVRTGCDRVLADVGAVDILINCAGVNLRPPLAELTDDQYEQTMAINLHAPYLLGQRFGPPMAERGWGRIINIGSQQGWSAFGNSGAYGISKAGIAGLSRSQADAWSRDGVTSNTIVPGFVVTPMTEQTIAEPGREEALAARTMIGRNGAPADFAGAAVFLASDAAAYVTGQTLAVDGGFSVH